MNEKIKPCPFCGGKAHFARQRGPVDYYMFYHTCKGPTSNRIDIHACYFVSKEEAIEHWNRRAGRVGRWIGAIGDIDGHPVYESFTCSECGRVYGAPSDFCPCCGAQMKNVENEEAEP